MKSARLLLSRLGLLSCLCLPLVAQAAGPEKVATLKRDLWPYPISSSEQFDRASNAEIQMLTLVLSQTALQQEADIKAFTGLKKINPEQVQHWLTSTRQRLLNNHRQACHSLDAGSCATDWPALQQLSQKQLQQQLPSVLAEWAQHSRKFHQRYLYEQVRLAALFPRISSEIEVFSEQEVSGFELNDGEFLLTYDDGPSAKRSAPLTQALNQLNIHAFFFVLGENLKNVKPPKALYKDQCLASHGYQHKSHQKWDNWQQSLADTRTQLNAYQPGPYWFRPPYGQRQPALLTDLQQQQEKLMLWNIDSQDWNRKLTDQQVADRVTTLMLLWRRGIILYHDIHSRALHNLPALQQLVQQSNKQWLDCRQF